MINKRFQRGVSPVTVLVVGALLACVLLLGMRSVPVINEYMAVKRAVNRLAEEGEGGSSIAELRDSFDRRAQIDDITRIKAQDLNIRKVGNKTLIDVEYDAKVPVVGNVKLLFEFHAKSESR